MSRASATLFSETNSDVKFASRSHVYLHKISFSRSHERTQEELELVFEELLHIPALSHLSTSIKRELASIIVFESHAQAGTVCELNSKFNFNALLYIGFHC